MQYADQHLTAEPMQFTITGLGNRVPNRFSDSFLTKFNKYASRRNSNSLYNLSSKKLV